MSNQKLTILGIITAGMIVWAVVQSGISSKPGTEQTAPSYLIQGLNPADIDSIVVGRADKTVTLKRRQEGFVVVEKDNYPAAASRINELITKCLDIRTAELYTDDRANHDDLGVAEEQAEAVVRFLKPDSALLTGVVIGLTRETGQGTYVRLVDDDKVYVTLERPWVNDWAMNYIDQSLIEVDDDAVESVTVSGPNEVYTLAKTSQTGAVVLEPMPAGSRPKADEYQYVLTAVKNLRFDDVSRQSGLKEKLDFDRRFTCTLKDSTVYTLNIAQSDGKTYVTCDAEFTDPQPVTKEKTVESEEQLKQKEAKLLARDKANEFSARHKGWIYQISDYKAKLMVKKLSELVETEKPADQAKQVSDDDSSTAGDTGLSGQGT